MKSYKQTQWVTEGEKLDALGALVTQDDHGHLTTLLPLALVCETADNQERVCVTMVEQVTVFTAKGHGMKVLTVVLPGLCGHYSHGQVVSVNLN